MKTKTLITIVLLMSACILSAQDKPQPNPVKQEQKREKIDAMKVGFITNQLQLTPQEAQVFWPIYNQYEKEKRDAMKSRATERFNAKTNSDKMTDKDWEKLADDEIIFAQKMLDLAKKYHAQFKTVLPIKKVVLLYKAEKLFRKELLKKIKDRNPNKENPHKQKG
ncbi:MAG: hypothetical protein PHD97_03705 [Bacteroidales bacterium]|nr:hypothetical protein [Bacteroidales bacterium]